METPIFRKGEVLCKFAAFWFDRMDTPNHRVKIQDHNKMIVKKLDMLPIEFVVRGFFYGSLQDRYKKSPEKVKALLPKDFQPITASRLPEPILDPTKKSEQHDEPIDSDKILSQGIISNVEYKYLRKTSLDLYKKMSQIVESAGFLLADVKFEFGRDKKTGEILLGDSLGPDEFRLWLLSEYIQGKEQKSYDKQLLRDWLIKIGFKDKVDEYSKMGKKPIPPEIPPSIAHELSKRYIMAFERITSTKI